MNTNNNESSRSSRFFDEIRSFNINRQANRWLGGVCAGLAERIDINVYIIRALFAISPFITLGSAFLIYIILWLFLPDATKGGHIIVQGSSSKNSTYSGDEYTNNENNMSSTYHNNNYGNTPSGSDSPFSKSPNRETKITQTHDRVSSSYTLAVLGLIFLVISFAILYGLVTRTIFTPTIVASAVIAIIFGISILIAGIKGKKATTLVIIAILSTIFISAPTTAVTSFVHTVPFHSATHDDDYHIDSILNRKTEVINLDKYASSTPNSKGEVVIEQSSSSFASKVVIVANNKPVKVNFNGSTLKANVFSNRQWLKRSQNNWTNTSSLPQNNATEVTDDSKVSLDNLGFYDYNGAAINANYMTFISLSKAIKDLSDYSDKHIQTTNKIKTADYDDANKKYVVNMNSNFAEVDVVDLPNHWYGYTQKDSSKPNGIAYKQLFAYEKGKLTQEIPANIPNKESYSQITANNLELRNNTFDGIITKFSNIYSSLDNNNHTYSVSPARLFNKIYKSPGYVYNIPKNINKYDENDWDETEDWNDVNDWDDRYDDYYDDYYDVD
ncbi:PspC domain-containing protein [Actinomyces sp. zg-332]|uniref:PspC domain-containing protein n=1 Tax=Actinomyces sp. zg-332 TaxID=2708340 RepID=UPI00141F79F3|nr:PspC domain-containing protein [Actinomyces sp. zg-332]QPK93849.1 PspC domain-containing protein [Actinomyces sp. zg-332]